MRKFILYTLLIFGSTALMAQDFQFSQLKTNQALHFPASFGLKDSNGQLDLAYRSLNVDDAPFRTMLFSYQQKVKDFTVGARIIQNDAGSASLKRSKLILNFSYKKVLNEIGDAIVFGADVGVLQQRFQTNLFEFDNQYIGGQGFNAAINNGESFSLVNQIVPVLNVSLIGRKQIKRIKTTFGATLNNINQPSIGFYDFKKEPMQVGISVFGLADVPFGRKSKASFYFLRNHLEIESENIVGLKLKRFFSDTNAIHIGFANRIGAAFILEAGINIKQINFSLSYDFDSDFNSMLDSYKGLFELSASYNLKK